MRITRLATRNYRTLGDLDLSFPLFYSAICGRNDSGKTNVVRAIRCLMKEDEPFHYGDKPEFSLKEDYTKWLDAEPKGRSIRVEINLRINAEIDAGLFQFFRDYLILEDATDELDLNVAVTHGSDGATIEVAAQNQRFDGLKAQEVLKRLL